MPSLPVQAPVVGTIVCDLQHLFGRGIVLSRTVDGNRSYSNIRMLGITRLTGVMNLEELKECIPYSNTTLIKHLSPRLVGAYYRGSCTLRHDRIRPASLSMPTWKESILLTDQHLTFCAGGCIFHISGGSLLLRDILVAEMVYISKYVKMLKEMGRDPGFISSLMTHVDPTLEVYISEAVLDEPFTSENPEPEQICCIGTVLVSYLNKVNEDITSDVVNPIYQNLRDNASHDFLPGAIYPCSPYPSANKIVLRSTTRVFGGFPYKKYREVGGITTASRILNDNEPVILISPPFVQMLSNLMVIATNLCYTDLLLPRTLSNIEEG